MTSTKTHHNLKIKSEIGLKKILGIQMSIKKNHHGRLEVVGIPDKEIQEYLNTPLIDKDFILLTKDEQDKEEIVFSGIIEKIEQQKEKGIDKVKLQVVTKSIILDRQEKSRSFQNINQTYEEIAKEILKEYSGAVIATVGEKVPIGKPLIQYKETDWEFIKRITSHFESIIYPEYKQAKPNIYMGYPKTLKEEELQEDNYEYGLEQTYYQMKNTNKQDTIDDYTYVKIETNKNKNIADQGNFKGRGYKIYEKEAKLKDQELKYTYKYGAKGNQKTPIAYNEQITGMTLLGEVEKTDKEEVNINLRIDKGKKGQYPYPFRPETGNMLYNMPQKGTTVSLYMPNHDERFAMIINSIRQNTSQDMTDPSKRTFTTEHGKKLDLYPNQIKLQSKTTGTKISLDDPDAINLNSHKNINIIAKEEILLKAKVINIDAKEELNLIKGDALSGTVESSITQSTEIDNKSKTQTKISGTDKAEYPQIQDAPPEKEEKGNAWVNFAIGALATVGLVVATVATGGLAGGLVALALGGAVLGAATVTVAMTGEALVTGKAKPLGEAIKEIAIGAVTGAIGGVLPGSTAVWIGIGGGIEGTVDRFLRGEKTTAGNLMQDIFLSMATAGILDNVGRKISKTRVYKEVQKRVKKTAKEVGERVSKKAKEIFKAVVDTFSPKQELVTPEGIVFSTRNIDDTLGNNAEKQIKNIVSDAGGESAEKIGKESTKNVVNKIDNDNPTAFKQKEFATILEERVKKTPGPDNEKVKFIDENKRHERRNGEKGS